MLSHRSSHSFQQVQGPRGAVLPHPQRPAALTTQKTPQNCNQHTHSQQHTHNRMRSGTRTVRSSTTAFSRASRACGRGCPTSTSGTTRGESTFMHLGVVCVFCVCLQIMRVAGLLAATVSIWVVPLLAVIRAVHRVSCCASRVVSRAVFLCCVRLLYVLPCVHSCCVFLRLQGGEDTLCVCVWCAVCVVRAMQCVSIFCSGR